MSALGGRDRAFHAGRSGTDHHDSLLHRSRGDVVLGLDLVAQRRVHGAGVGQVAEQPGEAVERADAGTRFVEPVLRRLVNEIRIGKQRPACLPEIELAVLDALVGHDRVGQAVAEGDRRVRKHLLGADGEPVPKARRDVAADGRFGRLLPAHDHAEHVDPAFHRLSHQFVTLVLGVAAPLVHQLGAVQPQREGMIGRRLLDRVDQLAHETAAVEHRPSILVGALVGEFRVEIRQQVAHEARKLGAVEADFDRAPGGLGELLDRLPDLLLGNLPRRPEMREGLRHDRRLETVAQIDAAVAACVQDLLERHRARVVKVAGDLLKSGHELVVVQRKLAEVGLALAQGIGIGALVDNDAAADVGDHLHARELPRRDEPVAGPVVGHATGAVLDAVPRRKLADAARLEQVFELCLARLDLRFGWSHWVLEFQQNATRPSSGILSPSFRVIPGGANDKQSSPYS